MFKHGTEGGKRGAAAQLLVSFQRDISVFIVGDQISDLGNGKAYLLLPVIKIQASGLKTELLFRGVKNLFDLRIVKCTFFDIIKTGV